MRGSSWRATAAAGDGRCVHLGRLAGWPVLVVEHVTKVRPWLGRGDELRSQGGEGHGWPVGGALRNLLRSATSLVRRAPGERARDWGLGRARRARPLPHHAQVRFNVVMVLVGLRRRAAVWRAEVGLGAAPRGGGWGADRPLVVEELDALCAEPVGGLK
eukprot:7579337-Alexandrium_andersonii.AAC.1